MHEFENGLTNEQAIKLAEFRDRRIAHDAFQDALTKIANFHQTGRYASRPGILTMVGETGAGKTSIIEDYCNFHNKSGRFKKVLFVIVPESCTVKNLAASILMALGDLSSVKGTRQDMELRIKDYVVRTGVELLIFDEFQHLTNRGSARRQYDAADWLKTQVEILRKPIVFAGLPEVHNIFSVNPQLETRRNGKIGIEPFNLDAEEARRSVVLFFHMLNKHLPLPRPEVSALNDPVAIKYIVDENKGLLGYMMRTVHCATELAMLEGDETLRLNHLHEAVRILGAVEFDVGEATIRPGKKKTPKDKGIGKEDDHDIF
ncbi:TniB family NTP-binding protein [Thalassospira povalilytica]|uniref:TniB family NTP-binding protein n=1 Tax=Thalassospira povalilytica TaxID=732237 RepID=A0A8I1SIQ4_9PROT|nr:TniB family NTP-binding protein [Thalassospira povalilytica]MBN8196029.1 TniB family NTP-binding protein [Thalassospira povalilytica]